MKTAGSVGNHKVKVGDVSIQWMEQADRIVVTHMASTINKDNVSVQDMATLAMRGVLGCTRLRVSSADIIERWSDLRRGNWSDLRKWSDEEVRILRAAFNCTGVTVRAAGGSAAACIFESVGTMRTAAACVNRASMLECVAREPTPINVGRAAMMSRDEIEILVRGGTACTVKEIAARTGRARTTVHRHLAALVASGRLAHTLDVRQNAYRYEAACASSTVEADRCAGSVSDTSVPDDIAHKALRVALTTGDEDARAVAAWVVGSAGLSALDVLNAALGSQR